MMAVREAHAYETGSDAEEDQPTAREDGSVPHAIDSGVCEGVSELIERAIPYANISKMYNQRRAAPQAHGAAFCSLRQIAAHFNTYLVF